MSDTEVICGVREASCICKLGPGHDGPHECGDGDGCDGSWAYDDDGRLQVVRLPGGRSLGDAFSLLFDGGGLW